MLLSLSIRDIVLIERLDLALRPGLCALTGETGAGKSILLDSLGLALGARAESRLVRHGAVQASVSAEFELPHGHPAHAILDEQGLAGGEETVILRRVLTADGRSRAFVNDAPASVGILRRIGETLVEVHGQFETQGLLNPATHRAVLDTYGRLGPELEATRGTHRAWKEAGRRAREAEAALAEARRDEEFLRHALDELTVLAARPGEEAELAERRAMMMHGEKLLEGLNAAATELAAGHGVEAALRGALRHLERVAERADGRLDEAIAALDRAALEVAEGSAALDRASRDVDIDPRHLEQVEERLFALRAAARKHAVDVDGLAALVERMAAQLAGLEDGGTGLERLRRDEARAREAYLAAAATLGAGRRAAAGRLDAAVAGELAPLRLGKATFATRVDLLADAVDWSEQGCEKVSFLVATNPGAPAGPLDKIASGGELARFMLALKACLADADPIPTLVFDEVDSGVGGATAAAVGDRLARLAEGVQVLVVTHSPQVAARAAHHWHVAKVVAGETTQTTIRPLDAAERREEIARMLAGAEVTDAARAAAGSLLAGGAL